MSKFVDVPLKLYEIFMDACHQAIECDIENLKNNLYRFQETLLEPHDKCKKVSMSAEAWQHVLSASIACHVGDYSSTCAALHKAHMIEKGNTVLN